MESFPKKPCFVSPKNIIFTHIALQPKKCLQKKFSQKNSNGLYYITAHYNKDADYAFKEWLSSVTGNNSFSSAYNSTSTTTELLLIDNVILTCTTYILFYTTIYILVSATHFQECLSGYLSDLRITLKKQQEENSSRLVPVLSSWEKALTPLHLYNVLFHWYYNICKLCELVCWCLYGHSEKRIFPDASKPQRYRIIISYHHDHQVSPSWWQYQRKENEENKRKMILLIVWSAQNNMRNSSRPVIITRAGEKDDDDHGGF